MAIERVCQMSNVYPATHPLRSTVGARDLRHVQR
jgi:hypothetical protein